MYVYCTSLGILGGTPVLLRIQSLRTVPMNVSMGVVSFLGEEEFYTILVVLILWLFDARLGRLLSLLMAISFYITGQFIKLVIMQVRVYFKKSERGSRESCTSGVWNFGTPIRSQSSEHDTERM